MPIAIYQEKVIRDVVRTAVAALRTWIGATQRLDQCQSYELCFVCLSAHLCMVALLRSSLVASVEIIVVICPTLCFIRARPLRRRDLRNMAPINCESEGARQQRVRC